MTGEMRIQFLKRCSRAQSNNLALFSRRSSSVLSVRVGSSFIGTGGTLRNVDKVHQHPRYDIVTINFDFAILELLTTLPSGPRIQTIALSDADPVEDKNWFLRDGVILLREDCRYQNNCERLKSLP